MKDVEKGVFFRTKSSLLCVGFLLPILQGLFICPRNKMAPRGIKRENAELLKMNARGKMEGAACWGGTALGHLGHFRELSPRAKRVSTFAV